jgi:hypothetical protein
MVPLNPPPIHAVSNLRPRTQDCEVRGSQSRPVDARPTGIGGKDPQQLPRNADRTILWPDCSYRTRGHDEPAPPCSVKRGTPIGR